MHGLGVSVPRQAVVRVVHLHALERRNDVDAEAVGTVRQLQARASVTLQVPDAGLVAHCPKVLGRVPERFDEAVVVVDLAALGSGCSRSRVRAFVEPVPVVLGQRDRFLAGVERPLPLFGIVGLAHQRRAVVVAETRVELRVAVAERTGGIEQQPGLHRLGRHRGGAPQVGIGTRRIPVQQIGRAVVGLGDERHAFVERTAGP